MKKLIKNVVLLDMTTATPESVEGVTISNAVTVFVTGSTKSLLGKINFGNLVSVIEMPDGVIFSKSNGQMTIGGSLSSQEWGGSSYKLINGSLLIRNDVSEETLLRIFEHGGIVNGSATVPDSLSAAFQSAKIHLNGELKAYPWDSVLFEGDMVINNGFLKGLEPNSKITVTGNVTVEPGTNPELFESSISKLTLFGSALMHEKISEAFYRAATKYDGVTILPDGYTLYGDNIIITPSNILSFRKKKLYTRDNVIFGDGLTEAMIEQNDFQIKAEGVVFCPEGIAQCVLDRVITDRFQTYGGVLIMVDEYYSLDIEDLKENSGVSFYVNDTLDISGELSVEAINGGVSDIFLYGTISLDGKHMRSVSKKIRINEGGIDIKTTEPPSEEQNEDGTDSEYDIVISNAVEYVM